MNKKISILLVLFFFAANINIASANTTIENFKYYQQQVKMQRYPWNMSGFAVACQKGNTELVENYIKGGMNVNQPYLDGTPLLMAISSENNETVELLLKNGADPNQERATLTPLHLAIRRNLPEIVNTLIKYNVDVNKKCKNKKPINFAIKKNNCDIIKMLIDVNVEMDDKTKKMLKKSKCTIL